MADNLHLAGAVDGFQASVAFVLVFGEKKTSMMIDNLLLFDHFDLILTRFRSE